MINILIVEDDKAISNLIKLTVKRTGFFCDTAYDGEAALEKINEKRQKLKVKSLHNFCLFSFNRFYLVT